MEKIREAQRENLCQIAMSEFMTLGCGVVDCFATEEKQDFGVEIIIDNQSQARIKANGTLRFTGSSFDTTKEAIMDFVKQNQVP